MDRLAALTVSAWPPADDVGIDVCAGAGTWRQAAVVATAEQAPGERLGVAEHLVEGGARARMPSTTPTRIPFVAPVTLEPLGSSQLVLGVPLLSVVIVAFYLVASSGTPFAFATTVIAVGYLAALIQLPAAADRLELGIIELWKTSAVIAWRQPLLSLGVVMCVVVVAVGAWFAAPLAVPLYFPALPAFLGSLVLDRGLRRFAGSRAA